MACCALVPALVGAAPDEDLLGRGQGYPSGNAANWFYSEAVRVGSFSHQGQISGVLNGAVHELAPSARPMPLRRAATELSLRWSSDAAAPQSIDDYLARHRVMGLMIIKDDEVLLERYQYQRGPEHRFVSHSMSKSIVSLAIGLALAEGRIASLDDRADRYARRLEGSLYGQTSLRNLLRMGSGARFEERYDGRDDLARFSALASRDGLEQAASSVSVRLAPQGTRFNYASAETTMLAAVLRGATGQSLSAYLTPRLWQAMGAETSALWHTDLTGLETAAGNFNATLRDYARLGVLLAHDGRRPDTGEQILPRDYLIEATDWHRHALPFQPGKASSYYGYGYQFWTFPGARRRFALTGVFGQLLYVDPQLRLVMVQTAADASASAAALTRDADALWRALVGHFGGAW